MWTLKVWCLFLLANAFASAQNHPDYTPIEDAPFVVKIIFKNRFACVGSIVDYRWIITTASCLYGYGARPGLFKVLIGSDERSETAGEVRLVEKIIRHAKYDNSKLNYDIAMMKLKTAVPLHGRSQMVPLCTSPVPVGAVVRELGWSDTKTTYYDYLRTNELTTISHQDCRVQYETLGYTLSNKQMCTSVTDQLKCYSNAGSPLMYGIELCGLGSQNVGCWMQGAPYVFTDIMSLKPFIMNTMANF